MQLIGLKAALRVPAVLQGHDLLKNVDHVYKLI